MRTSLVAVCLMVAAPLSPAQVGNDTLRDVIVMAPERPVLIRFHLTINGKSPERAQRDYFTYLFHKIDVDKNGTLSAAEQRALPDSFETFRVFDQTLLAAVQDSSMSSGRLIRKTAGAVAAPAKLDQLITFYRRKGVVPVQLGGYTAFLRYEHFGKSQEYGVICGSDFTVGGSKTVGDASFALADVNRDGKLSQCELAQVAESLLRRDFDDDEVLLPTELVQAAGATPVDRASGRRGIGTSAPFRDWRFALLHVRTENGSPELGRRLWDRYAPLDQQPAKDKPQQSLTRAQLALDPKCFSFLDRDGDQRLSPIELDRFPLKQPDFTLLVNVGDKPLVKLAQPRIAGPECQTQDVQEQITELLNADGRRVVAGTVIDAASARMEVVVAEATDLHFNAKHRHQHLARVLRTCDRDENGYLDRAETRPIELPAHLFSRIDADSNGMIFLTELKSYYDGYFEQQNKACNSWLAIDLRADDRGLFGILDADGDSRLSVREMKRAPRLLATLDRNKNKTLQRTEIEQRFRISFSRGANYPRLPHVPAQFAAKPPGATPVESPQWFYRMDRNKDGNVSEREFLGRADKFREMDRDGDGLLDLTEARQADARLRKTSTGE